MPGQTSPVTVTATKIDETQQASIEITAEDTVGLMTTFDPAFVTVYRQGGPEASTLSDIPAAEHLLTVTNGTPGLGKLDIRVNARTIALPLKDGETRTST